MTADYADTFGHHSAKYFQDFRHRTLETSRTNLCQGGYFPSLYSFGPQSAVESRTRRWDRWLKTPHCRLLTTDHDRREELMNFWKVRATFLWSIAHSIAPKIYTILFSYPFGGKYISDHDHYSNAT
jgi:Protein of unknown function (DUF2475)